MTQEEWLRYGFEQGYCGPPVCYTHDGTPLALDEDESFMDGDDPCVHILRLYEDPTVRAAVEANHSPSQWRASNQGWNK